MKQAIVSGIRNEIHMWFNFPTAEKYFRNRKNPGTHVTEMKLNLKIRKHEWYLSEASK
jgi:hypothetical protein